MKKVALFLSMLLVAIISYAQQDIFQKHGFNKETFTLSKGKYNEIFTNEDVVQIGTVLIDTRNDKIVEFLEEDTMMFAYKAETTSRFLTIDPLAEKYYNWSPYVYCKNNPINAIDLRGDSVTYVGSAADLQAVDAVHNQNLGGYYTISTDPKTGLSSMSAVKGADLSKMTKEQKAYYIALDKVVNGTDGMTTINVVNESEDVLIGLASAAKIDIGDIQKIGNGNVSSGGALMHETWEQYKIQVGKVDINKAHKQAIGVENTISGQQSLGATMQYDYQSNKTGVTSPIRTITIPFKNSAPTIIRVRNNNIITPIIR